jgi:predicted aspartyl protease
MRLSLALLLLLLPACAGAPDPSGACGFAGQTTLPFAPAGPFAAVPSTADGTPVTLIVDTGAAETVFSAAAAQRARVVPDTHHTVRATGIGGTASYAVGRVGMLRLGAIPVTPAVVTIMPTVPVADGNLGMDILGDVDLDLDFPSRRITLYRGRLCPDATPPWDAKAIELATVALVPRTGPPGLRPRQLLLAMELEGQPALAMIDTGAAASVVARAFVRRLGVSDAALAASPSVPLTGLSPAAALGRIWRFREAAVGSEHFPGPLLLVADLPGAQYDVLLGMDYLSKHRLWLSYGARRIFIARGQSPLAAPRHPGPPSATAPR